MIVGAARFIHGPSQQMPRIGRDSPCLGDEDKGALGQAAACAEVAAERAAVSQGGRRALGRHLPHLAPLARSRLPCRSCVGCRMWLPLPGSQAATRARRTCLGAVCGGHTLGILVELADVVQGSADTADWAAAVVHDMGEDAGVAEDKAGRGHLGWVAALAPAWEGGGGGEVMILAMVAE